MLITRILITLIAVIALGGTGHADTSRLVMQPVKQVFIPQGFDSNDDVQVMIFGTLTDTCRKIAHTQVLELPDGEGYQVIQWVRRFEDLCLPMSTPFFSEVTLGRLSAGDHIVKSLGVEDMTVQVAEATTGSPDDFLYAPVHHAAVLPTEGSYTATLTGSLPNDCFHWKEVKLIDQGDVIVLLPILEYIDNGQCSADPVAFEKEILMPDNMAMGYHLLHVRSMSGKAVNSVFFVDGDR